MFYLLLFPLGYLVICAILYFQQDSMVFLPARNSFAQLEKKAATEGFEPWLSAKGERIGWQSQEGNPDNVLLVFNGNGGYALDRAFYREFSRDRAGGWKTFLLEYPGYGSRTGQPSEKSLTAAALEAVDTLAAVPDRKIWLLGESLGSGTASATVAARPEKIAGLLLVTPFNSLVAAAANHYPWLPVSLLLKTRFDSEKNLAKYPGPVAFLLSEKDTIVPAVLGQKLYDGYQGRKRLWIDPESDHDVFGLLDAEWPKIVQWLQDEGTRPDSSERIR